MGEVTKKISQVLIFFYVSILLISSLIHQAIKNKSKKKFLEKTSSLWLPKEKQQGSKERLKIVMAIYCCVRIKFCVSKNLGFIVFNCFFMLIFDYDFKHVYIWWLGSDKKFFGYFLKFNFWDKFIAVMYMRFVWNFGPQKAISWVHSCSFLLKKVQKWPI